MMSPQYIVCYLLLLATEGAITLHIANPITHYDPCAKISLSTTGMNDKTFGAFKLLKSTCIYLPKIIMEYK